MKARMVLNKSREPLDSLFSVSAQWGFSVQWRLLGFGYAHVLSDRGEVEMVVIVEKNSSVC